MTNKTQKKTLEERTASRIDSIKNLMRGVNDLIESGKGTGSYGDSEDHLINYAMATFDQTSAIYEQNAIIIDYLKAMYKGMKK